MAFNFTQFINAINIAPYVVAGIEAIHTEMDSVSKTQVAQDALALAAGVAGAIVPGEEAVIAAASSVISGIITGIQNVKAASASPATPAPAAPVTPSV